MFLHVFVCSCVLNPRSGLSSSVKDLMGDSSPPKAASSSLGGAELLDLVEPPPPTDFSKQIEAGSGRGWEYFD